MTLKRPRWDEFITDPAFQKRSAFGFILTWLYTASAWFGSHYGSWSECVSYFSSKLQGTCMQWIEICFGASIPIRILFPWKPRTTTWMSSLMTRDSFLRDNINTSHAFVESGSSFHYPWLPTKIIQIWPVGSALRCWILGNLVSELRRLSRQLNGRAKYFLRT